MCKHSPVDAVEAVLQLMRGHIRQTYYSFHDGWCCFPEGGGMQESAAEPCGQTGPGEGMVWPCTQA